MIWLLFFLTVSAFGQDNYIKDLGWVEDQERGMCYGYFRPMNLPKWVKDLPDDQFGMSVDKKGIVSRNNVQLKGNVALYYNNIGIFAKEASWQRGPMQTIKLRDRVKFIAPSFTAVGKSATYHRGKNAVDMNAVGFRLWNKRQNQSKTFWGSAESLNFDVNRSVLTLNDGEFSVCSPSNTIWQISSDKAILDSQNKLGTVHHARWSVYGIPLLYIPWLQFPLEDARASGFLPPNFGFNQQGGVTLMTPYYFNLAPNYDLTVAPFMGMSRLFGIRNKLRYLSPLGLSRVDFNLLRGDGETHYSYHLLSHLAYRAFAFQAQLLRVSDDAFIRNYAMLRPINSSLLERSAKLDYTQPSFDMSLGYMSYQDLNIVNNDHVIGAYGYEPSFRATYFDSFGRFDVGQQVHFDVFKPVKSRPNLPSGKQSVSVTTSSIVQDTPFGLLSSELGLTGLLMHAKDQSHDFLQPRFMLRWDNLPAVVDHWLIQPSVGYLWAPYHKMADLPLFNTRIKPFLLEQLFNFNRFYGYSRLGDYNDIDFQLRILSKSSPLVAVLGQRFAPNLHRQYILDGYQYTDPSVIDKWSPTLLKLSYPMQSAALYSDMSFKISDRHIQNIVMGYKQQIGKQNFDLYFAKYYRHIDDKYMDNPLRIAGLRANVIMNAHWRSDVSVVSEFRRRARVGGEAVLIYNDCCNETRFTIRKDISDDDMSKPASGFGFSLKFSLIGLN